MKKILTLGISFILVLLFAQTALAQDVSLKINGRAIPTDTPPVIKSGRTLVPVRVISEALGADVIWDQTARKVKINKNNNLIELSIDQKEVFKNGELFQNLDVPAQIINGRTLVPVRFIGEAFGATVNWDPAAYNVNVDFQEKRDGMTPEELMQKSLEATQKYNTYKFKGEGVISLTGSAFPQKIDTSMTMEGSYKKVGDKASIYVTETIDVPAVEGSAQTKLTVEIYTDGSSIYQKMNGTEWQKLELGTDLTQLMQYQDPQKATQLLKDFGLIFTHGNEVSIDGKDYYTLMVKIDAEKYKSFINQFIEGAVSGNTPEAQDLIKETISSMNMDLSEKIYIEKATYLNTGVDLNGRISMAVQGNSIVEDLTMKWTMYDFGADVKLPQVNE